MASNVRLYPLFSTLPALVHISGCLFIFWMQAGDVGVISGAAVDEVQGGDTECLRVVARLLNHPLVALPLVHARRPNLVLA